MIGLAELQFRGIDLRLVQRGDIVFLECVAVGLVHQIIETLLVNILFAELPFNERAGCFTPAKPANVDLLHKLAKSFIRSFFQFVPGVVYIKARFAPRQFFYRDLHISSKRRNTLYYMESSISNSNLSY